MLKLDSLKDPYQLLFSKLVSPLIQQRLNTPLGWAIVASLAALIGVAIAVMGVKGGILVLGGLLGVPVLLLLLFYPVLGVGTVLICSFFIEFLRKFSSFPAGIAMDGLTFMLFGGLIVSVARTRKIGFAKHPISLFIVFWVLYNLIQFFNPVAGSQLAWIYTVRSMAGLILFYFVAAYALNSFKKLIGIIGLMILFALISALYGLKQEFFGFLNSELIWLYSDPERFRLIYQWGRLRVFSFSSNPTNFGISMAFLSAFCVVLATGPYKWWLRIGLLGIAGAMLLAMAYAGSRTPFILLPAGMVYYTLITMNKKVILSMAFIGLLGAAFVMKSTSNPVIFRIQSAFKLEDSEDTVGVRMRNQKKIQPFIQAHPFGSGLGSTGVWGRRFTPDSWLADFAHDSGYVRIAVELGWVGLIIYLAMLFVIMRYVVFYYLRVNDPTIKNIYLALGTAIFMLVVANYPQEAIVQLPMSIIFYVMLALIVRLKDYG